MASDDDHDESVRSPMTSSSLVTPMYPTTQQRRGDRHAEEGQAEPASQRRPRARLPNGTTHRIGVEAASTSFGTRSKRTITTSTTCRTTRSWSPRSMRGSWRRMRWSSRIDEAHPRSILRTITRRGARPSTVSEVSPTELFLDKEIRDEAENLELDRNGDVHAQIERPIASRYHDVPRGGEDRRGRRGRPCHRRR